MGLLLFLSVCAAWPDDRNAPAVGRGGDGSRSVTRKPFAATESEDGEEEKRGLRHDEDPPHRASGAAPSERAPSATKRTALEEIDGRIDGSEGKGGAADDSQTWV